MKKNYLLIIMILFNVIYMPKAMAITEATASPTSTDSKIKQIDDLKERLATKVAQLQQLQRKATYGTVKAVSISNFTLETKTKDLKIELPDEINIFQIISGKRTKLTFDQLEKGDIVTVFGNYDTTLDLLKAKVIFIQNKSTPIRISGLVKSINKTDFSISLTTQEGANYTVDNETTTKSFIWDKDKGLVKIGFSKINAGDTLHILGFSVAKKDNQISASRILNLTDLSGTPPLPTTIATPSATSKVTPSPTP